MERSLSAWPLYFLLLAFLAPRAQEISPPLIHYLTFTQNFFSAKFFIQTWSLAIEEQFYFAFPLLMAALLLVRRLHWIAGVCIVGIAGAFAFRYFNFAGNHTVAAIDSILVGILIGYLHHFKSENLAIIRKNYGTSIIPGVLVAYLPFLLPDPSSAREMLLRGGFALGFGLIVAACSAHEFPRVRWIESRLVGIIAMTSYANYLAHDRPLFWVARAANAMSLEGAAHTTFILVIGVTSSIALACVIYPLIELPALRLRDRVFPRR